MHVPNIVRIYPFNIEGIGLELDRDRGIQTTHPNGNCGCDLRKLQGGG